MSTEVLEEPAPTADQPISTLQKYYDKIFKDGSLMQVHIKMWGMAARLDEEDLDVEEQLPDIFKLGKKMLIKPTVYNEFKQVENKARNYLKRNSFKFHISDAHFVPTSRLDEVERELDKYKQQFETLTEQFFANYERYKEEFLTDHEAQRNILEGCYPRLQDLQNRFKFDYSEFRIGLPSLVEEVQTAVDREVKKLTDSHRDKLTQQAEKQQKMLMDFTSEAGNLLRSNVTAQCAVIAGKISRGEVVSKTNIKTLVQKVTDFKELNFLDDKEMSQQLDGLLDLLNKGHDYKEDSESLKLLSTSLNEVLDNTKSMTEVSALTGEYFRALEID